MPRHQKKSSGKATIPSQLLIQLANKCDDPLKVLEHPEEKNGSKGEIGLFFQTNRFRAKFQCFTWPKLSTDLQEWIIDLTEQNMKDLYESSGWKWNRQSKLSEMKHQTSRHLIVFNMDGTAPAPVAFAHFRFEEGYSSDATLYCYELQIIPSCKRLGIGRHLMNILQTMASKYRMKKTLVTVLKNNTDAFEFYTKGLQFKIDPNSPSSCQQEAVYEILSKKVTPIIRVNDENDQNQESVSESVR